MGRRWVHEARSLRPAGCLLALILVLSAAASDLGAAPRKDDWRLEPFHWRGELGDAATVRVHNPFGDVRARRSEGNAVSVHAAQQRHREDPRQWTISIAEGENGLEVEVVLAEGTVPTAAAEDWAPRRVDMTVYVPASARLDVEIVDGLIEAKGLGGDVAARSVAGEIVIITAGSADVRSEEGRIRYAFADPKWVGATRLTGGAGDILVTLPAGADVDLAIRTGGDIATDLALAPSPETGGTSHLVLGEGRSPIAIESDSGNVKVQRIPS